MTARDLITRSLQTLGVVAQGEVPTAQEADDALHTLQDMVDAWATERLTIYQVVRSTFPLMAFQPSYTIGPGGDFDVPRPLWVQRAGVILQTTPDTEVPLAIYRDNDWARVTIKTLQSSLPQLVYLDHGFTGGQARIWLWPVVNVSGLTLALYLPTPITVPLTLDTDILEPPGYRKALRFNLAVELAPEFAAPLDARVIQLATESKADIKRVNTQDLILTCDPALRSRRYTGMWDYRTGSVR